MINTNNADTASNPSDDSSASEKKLTTDNLNTTESTNAADSKGASSAAAIEEDVDMSAGIEIGAVDDADEYSIDQSYVDGGADDDLQKVFAGRPSEDYYWRTHSDKNNEWKLNPARRQSNPRLSGTKKLRWRGMSSGSHAAPDQAEPAHPQLGTSQTK